MLFARQAGQVTMREEDTTHRVEFRQVEMDPKQRVANLQMFVSTLLKVPGGHADDKIMDPATNVEISIFEALLSETDPAMSNLLSELLGLDEGSSRVTHDEWDGQDRRASAA